MSDPEFIGEVHDVARMGEHLCGERYLKEDAPGIQEDGDLMTHNVLWGGAL